MPSKSITDAFVKNVKAPDQVSRRQITYIDTLERGLALVLVVSYGGTKTFRVLTYRNGKAQTRKLGSYPQISVKDARAKAREYWENPLKFEAKASVGTFKEVAENWIKRYVDLHGLRSKLEIQRILQKHLYPEWADRPFVEIRRGEVNKLLDNVVDGHGPRKHNQRKNKGRSQADAVLAVKPSTAAMTPEQAYGVHQEGSRKGKVHQLFDEQGAEAAWVLGLKLKLKEGTLRSWFAAWKRLQSKSKGEVKINSSGSPAIKPDGVIVPSEPAHP